MASISKCKYIRGSFVFMYHSLVRLRLVELKLMEGSAKIISLIARDETNT